MRLLPHRSPKGAALISPVETWVGRDTGLLGELSPDALRRWQLERLRETIAYARGKGRFYGDTLRAFDPLSLASLEGLEDLPFTWPSDLLREGLSFLCVPRGEVARVTTLRSSGTSGPGKRLFFTEGDLSRTLDFFEQGMRCMVDAGQSALILMSGETENSIGMLLKAALARLDVDARIGGGIATVEKALEAARNADCIVGFPSDLLRLCRSDGRLRPRSVLLSADYVPRGAIRAIEDAWHSPVFTHYGMTETAFGLAVQCASREGHHLRAAEFLVEIVDPETGTRLGPGELGEIVLTTLRSEAMPLIRYRTGDLSRVLDGRCECGGVLPRLGRVEGRRDTRILLGSGASLCIHELDELLFAAPTLRGFEAELRRAKGGDVLILTIDACRHLDEGYIKAGLPSTLR